MRSRQNASPTPAFHVLIAAAGQGQRFGGNRPKQYAILNGRPLLRHTLDIFLNHQNLTSIHVIINPAHETLYHEATAGLDLPAPIYGSNKRKSSIYNALNKLSHLKSKEILLVHDAVRPLASPGDIQNVIQSAAETGASTLATRVTDTLRKNSGELVSRDGLWALQTPQAFHYGLLKRAHESCEENTATDDTVLVAAIGHNVAMVEGSRANIKITVPEDLELAARLMQKNYDIRTGMGYDVHAFDKNDPGRQLMLCGIKIEHAHGLAGHSDADVALHAITDALLGAIAEGDIGQHFPPSNPKYKNMGSDVFLKHAKCLADKKNALIQNIDVTIICEEPKIGPYREKMQTRIAQILSIAPTQIGIKATTTEKLGFLGRGEGIAVQAVATLKIPEKT